MLAAFGVVRKKEIQETICNVHMNIRHIPRKLKDDRGLRSLKALEQLEDKCY